MPVSVSAQRRMLWTTLRTSHRTPPMCRLSRSCTSADPAPFVCNRSLLEPKTSAVPTGPPDATKATAPDNPPTRPRNMIRILQLPHGEVVCALAIGTLHRTVYTGGKVRRVPVGWPGARTWLTVEPGGAGVRRARSRCGTRRTRRALSSTSSPASYVIAFSAGSCKHGRPRSRGRGACMRGVCVRGRLDCTSRASMCARSSWR